MDPFSGLALASSCMSLATKSGTLILRITIFVSEVRNARRDLDAVSRELTSLQLCLSALKDDQQFGSFNLPEDMKNHINQILVNIDLILNQISDMLIKLSSGKLGRRIQWVTTHKEEMNKFRCSLESNKSALEIALTLGSISLLAKQTQSMARQDGQVELLVQRTESISISTKIIDGKIDALTNMHQGDTRLDSITQEVSFLRTQMADLASNTSNATLDAFRKESEAYTQSLLRPIASALPDPNTVSASLRQSFDTRPSQPCTFCENRQEEIKIMKITHRKKEESYWKDLEDVEGNCSGLEARVIIEKRWRQNAEASLQQSKNAVFDLKETLAKCSRDRESLLDSITNLKIQLDEEKIHSQSLMENVRSNEKQISDLERRLEESSSAVDDLIYPGDNLKPIRDEQVVHYQPRREKIRSQERPLNVPEEFWMWWSKNSPRHSLRSVGLDPDTYGKFMNEDMTGLMNFNKALRAEYERLNSNGELRARSIPLARITTSHSAGKEYWFQCSICFIFNDQDVRLVNWNRNIFKTTKSNCRRLSRSPSVSVSTVGQLKDRVCEELKCAENEGLFTNADALFIQRRGERLSSGSQLRTASDDCLYLMLPQLDRHLPNTSNHSDLPPQRIFSLYRNLRLVTSFIGWNYMYEAYAHEGAVCEPVFSPKGPLRNVPWPIGRISDP